MREKFGWLLIFIQFCWFQIRQSIFFMFIEGFSFYFLDGKSVKSINGHTILFREKFSHGEKLTRLQRVAPSSAHRAQHSMNAKAQISNGNGIECARFERIWGKFCFPDLCFVCLFFFSLRFLFCFKIVGKNVPNQVQVDHSNSTHIQSLPIQFALTREEEKNKKKEIIKSEEAKLCLKNELFIKNFSQNRNSIFGDRIYRIVMCLWNWKMQRGARKIKGKCVCCSVLLNLGHPPNGFANYYCYYFIPTALRYACMYVEFCTHSVDAQNSCCIDFLKMQKSM